RFDISWGVAIFASLLYTFLPYHFARGQHHLFLSAYYFIPPVVMVALWICRGELFLSNEKPKESVGAKTSRLRALRRNPKFIFSLILCLLVGSAGYYYAFFSCFFLLGAGALAALRGKDARALLAPAFLVALIFAVTAINPLPRVARFFGRGGGPFFLGVGGGAGVFRLLSVA